MNEKYLLKTLNSTLENCPSLWELTLTEDDIEKINHLRNVTDESNRKFGEFSRLRFSFDVTDSFSQKIEGSEYNVDIIESRLEYIGRNKFQVAIDLLDQYGGQSCIFTDPFEIDFSKYAELEEDDSDRNYQESKKTIRRNFNEIKKIIDGLKESESVIRSLLKWEIKAHIYEISKSLEGFGNG
jgi:hypothetical protein